MFNLWGIFMTLSLLAAIAMVGLILLQQGKGADMGASFGAGASGSLFGASGSANPLSKATAWAAAIFFASTLGLTYIGYYSSPQNAKPKTTTSSDGVLEALQTITAPAVPTDAEAEGAITTPAAPEAAASSATDPAAPAAPNATAEPTKTVIDDAPAEVVPVVAPEAN